MAVFVEDFAIPCMEIPEEVTAACENAEVKLPKKSRMNRNFFIVQIKF
jgi:hypothetical protein